MFLKRSSFGVCLVLLLGLVGCGYVWVPLAQCTRDGDCNEQQVCLQGQCWTRNAGTEDSPCKRDRDCQLGLECNAQQRCARPVQESAPDEGTSSPDGGSDTDEPRADAGPGDRTQLPENPAQVVLRSSEPPVKGCLAGTARFCQYTFSKDEPACRFSTQSCLFNGGWTECGTGTGNLLPGREVTEWFPPSVRDFCYDRDSNCNGVENEGCPPRPGSSQCNKSHHIHFGPPVHHAAFQNSDNYSYSPAHNMALHLDPATGSLRLSRLRLDVKAADAIGPRMEWLFGFPRLGNTVKSYDLSKDGSLLAAAIKGKLLLWSLTYDQEHKPSVQYYGQFAIGNIAALGFAGPNNTLVLYQYETFDKKSYHNFSSWRISISKDNEISLTKYSQASPKDLTETFDTSMRHRLNIHPNGKWFVMASYRELLIYSVPELRVLHRTKLEFPPDPEERSLVFHPTKNILLLAPFNYSKLLTFAWQEDAKGALSFEEVQRYTVDNPSQLNRFGFHPETGELYATGASVFYHWKEPAQGQVSQGELLLTSANSTAFYPPTALAFLSGDNIIRAISAKDGKEHHRWQFNDPKDATNRYAYTLRLFPDGKRMLLFTHQRAQIWKLDATQPDALNPTLAQTLTTSLKSVQTNRPVAFSTDGKSFAWANENAIHVYKHNDNTNDFQSVSLFTQHTGNVKALAFHPTQPWLFSAGNDKEIRAWSLNGSANHKVVHTTTDPLIHLGFFKQDEEHFLLATLNNSDTFGFTFSTDTSSVPALKALEGKVNLSLNGKNITQVQYGNKAHLFIQYDPINNAKIVYHTFFLSPVQANGNRKLSQTSVKRFLPSTSGVNTSQYDESSRTYYGFTRDAIRVWLCPY